MSKGEFMKRSILAVILSLLLAAALPLTAFAEDAPDGNGVTDGAAGGTDDSAAAAQTIGTDQTAAGSGDAAGNAEGETVSTQKTITRTITIKENYRLQIKVKAKATGRGTIKVKWTRIKGSKGYRVYRASSSNGRYRRVFKTRRAGRRTWTDKSRKLKRNRTYYYKVKPNRAASLKRTRTKKVKVSVDAAAASTASVKKTVTAAAKPVSTKGRARNRISARRSFKVRATAYSGGGLCANGKRCKVGRIAVDPRVIPLGTWVYVDGYGLAQACDTGGAIKGRRIDLYFNGGERHCNRYGVRRVKIFILR